MAGEQRQEKIEYVRVEMPRENLIADAEALSVAVGVLSCDSWILDAGKTGQKLRRTRDRLICLRGLLEAARRAFDREKEELSR